jgi:hypothetical protein
VQGLFRKAPRDRSVCHRTDALNFHEYTRRHFSGVRLTHYTRIEEDLAAIKRSLLRSTVLVWKMWSQRKLRHARLCNKIAARYRRYRLTSMVKAWREHVRKLRLVGRFCIRWQGCSAILHRALYLWTRSLQEKRFQVCEAYPGCSPSWADDHDSCVLSAENR